MSNSPYFRRQTFLTSSCTNLRLGKEKRAAARSTFVRLPSTPSTSAPLSANSAEKSPSSEARSRILDWERGLRAESLTIWLMRARRLIQYRSLSDGRGTSHAYERFPPVYSVNTLAKVLEHHIVFQYFRGESDALQSGEQV